MILTGKKLFMYKLNKVKDFVLMFAITTATVFFFVFVFAMFC